MFKKFKENWELQTNFGDFPKPVREKKVTNNIHSEKKTQ